MSIFIILRLVQCTCFALYVLWNKWSTVTVALVVFISEIKMCLLLHVVLLVFKAQKIGFETENLFEL